MGWLYRFSIHYPRLTIGLGLAVTLAAAPGLTRLQIRTDGHALVPTDAPEIAVDKRIRDEFGLRDPLVILIRSRHADGVFNPETLALVDELTRALQALDGVDEPAISSLATEHGDRVFPGTLNFRRFLEPLPTTDVELHRLRTDLREIKLYMGTVVSYDERAAAIFVGLPAGVDRGEFYSNVDKLVSAHRGGPDRIDVIGAPVAEALLGTHILEDLGVPLAVLGASTTSESDELKGFPTTAFAVRLWLGRNVGLVPIALLVMILVFLGSFRSITAAALPMIEVGACLVFVFGLMGWVGVPVYLTIAVLPIILTAMGVADEIHIFSRYRALLRTDAGRSGDGVAVPSHVPVLGRTMDEMWRPVAKTSLTTAVAFLAFAMSPIAAVQAFGIFTAIGILYCMFWSLTVIPAQLRILRPAPHVRPPRSSTVGDQPGEPRYARCARCVVRYRILVLLAAAALAVGCTFGVRRVVVQDSWIDGFAARSRFYEATAAFNEEFLGMHQLFVVVDTGPDGVIEGLLPATALKQKEILLPADVVTDPAMLVSRQIEFEALEPVEVRHPGRDPRTIHPTWRSRIMTAERRDGAVVVTGLPQRGLPRLALRLEPTDQARYRIDAQRLKLPGYLDAVAALERFIAGRTDDAVGGVLGPASYLATTSFMTQARKEAHRRVPDDPERIEWLWNQYERIRGTHRRRELLDDDYRRGVLTVFMKDANFVSTARLMDAIRTYEREQLTPRGISLEFAGDVAVSQTLIRAIVDTQARSLAGSLIGIFLVTAILGRSLIWGLLCLLPCGLALLVNFAIMGFCSIPLGVATSMFAGMTLGVGVDYAIHLLERLRRARSTGLNMEDSLAEAMAVAGPAILIDALAVALGFGVLILSQVPANNRLGLLLALSVLNCLVATLVVLPAVVAMARRTDPASPAAPSA